MLFRSLSVQNVVTYNVIVNVDNARLELKPGMTANLTFTVAEKNAVLRLPNAALRYTPPGQSRESLRPDRGARGAEGQPGAASATAGKPADTSAGSPRASGRSENQAAGQRPARSAGTPGADGEVLAPGQLWKPGDKIQFPAPDLARTRRAMVWTLDERKQPQPRQVELGITDGINTEIVSGELQEGDAVLIGDSTQAAAQRTGGFFGGGGGPPGGGPR